MFLIASNSDSDTDKNLSAEIFEKEVSEKIKKRNDSIKVNNPTLAAMIAPKFKKTSTVEDSKVEDEEEDGIVRTGTLVRKDRIIVKQEVKLDENSMKVNYDDKGILIYCRLSIINYKFKYSNTILQCFQHK